MLIHILCLALVILVGVSGARAQLVIDTELEKRFEQLIGESYVFLVPEEKANLKLRKEPKYRSKNPRYGKLIIGNLSTQNTIAVVVDEIPNEHPPRIYVDGNNNLDLTDDGAPNLVLGQFGVYSKMVSIKATFIESGKTRTIELPYKCLFFSKSKQKELQLAFRPVFNRSGMLKLKNKDFKVLVHTSNPHGVFSDPSEITLGIDRNHDQRVDGSRLSGEMFEGSKPFNVDGETYRIAEISTTGDRVVVEVSPMKVAPKNHVVEGAPAPDFTSRTLDGRLVSLSDLKGKVVMLDFMAAWCAPCLAAIPDTKNLIRQFNDAEFALLSISLDGGDLTTRNDLEKIVSKYEIKWPVTFDGQGWNNAVARTYNVAQLPVHVVVDKEGVVRLIGRSGGEAETTRTKRVIGELITR